MQMILKGMGSVADEFVDAYEREAGERVSNLGFWELAAAARPMFSPEGWIDGSPARERFSRFIAGALEQAGA
jgi:hypothetical protein